MSRRIGHAFCGKLRSFDCESAVPQERDEKQKRPTLRSG